MTFLAGPDPEYQEHHDTVPFVVEPTAILPADEAKLVVVPPHNRVVSDQWIRNRIIFTVACTCFAVNVVTWLTTRDVNAVLIGAGFALLTGVPFINVGDRRGDGS